ncbi:MAG TPA: hypothetical protein VFS55_07900 [Dokdonella sp.]|nr:hypothetical protein [Dokdonella sp.]
MLKELNALAEALLGLEGYPTKPLRPIEAPRREPDADRDPATTACARGLPADAAADGRSTARC